MTTIIDGIPVELTEWGEAERNTEPVSKKQHSANIRQRRQRKRENALRFYFARYLEKGFCVGQIKAIYKKAPKLVERVADEEGVDDLGFLGV